eukprot:TRINITY_DN42217_c0_g2_i1.p1 TRINITY_DN42217_c0_g2~~TRINITY_DN42217_c0_g2_i1.p1  ORF type:complete len:1326 (+),score=207.37 TRINITY_DN42217_c0_g2_i1:108-4085(+)
MFTDCASPPSSPRKMPVTWASTVTEASSPSNTMCPRSMVQAQQTLLAIVLADAVMLLLPAQLLSLSAHADRLGVAGETCAWTPRLLSLCGLGAASALWFSLIVLAAQVFVLNSCTSDWHVKLATNLGWHLVLPVGGMLVGGSLGAVGLWGVAVLSSGVCAGNAINGLPSWALCAGYVIACLYIIPVSTSIRKQRCSPRRMSSLVQPEEACSFDGVTPSPGPTLVENSPIHTTRKVSVDSGCVVHTDILAANAVSRIASSGGVGIAGAVIESTRCDGDVSTVESACDFPEPAEGARVDAAKNERIDDIAPSPPRSSESIPCDDIAVGGGGIDTAAPSNDSVAAAITVIAVSTTEAEEPARRRSDGDKSLSPGCHRDASEKASSFGRRRSDGTRDRASQASGRRRTSSQKVSDASSLPRPQTTPTSIKCPFEKALHPSVPSPAIWNEPNQSDCFSSAFNGRRTSLRQLAAEAPPLISPQPPKEEPRDCNMVLPFEEESCGMSRDSVSARMGSVLKQTPVCNGGPQRRVSFSAESLMTRVASGNSKENVGAATSPSMQLADEPIHFKNSNPINFDKLKIREETSDSSFSSRDGSEQFGSGDSDGEVWCSLPVEQIEMPIWLLERSKQTKQAQTLSESSDTGHRVAETISAAHETASTRDEANSSNQGRDNMMRVENKEDISESPRSCSPVALSAPAGSDNDSIGTKKSSNKIQTPAFWKIPMPTRKNSIQARRARSSSNSEVQEVHGDKTTSDSDSDAGEAQIGVENSCCVMINGATSGIAGAECASQEVEASSSTDRLARPAESMRRKSCLITSGTSRDRDRRKTISGAPLAVSVVVCEGGPPKPVRSRPTKRKTLLPTVDDESSDFTESNSRRPSVLGVFSSENQASAQGLYALPKEVSEYDTNSLCPTPRGAEVVEVRRSSLVMSWSMMTDILKRKAIETDIEQTEKCGPCGDDEIVLPLFSPQRGENQRQCKCRVNEITKQVIHTCMTPVATHATNTVADVSWVCSAWGSRRGSLGGQNNDENSGEDGSYRSTHMPRKRIRNASVLMNSCSSGPRLATKSDGTGEGDSGEEGFGEGTGENELAVSFCTIRDSCLDSQRESSLKRKDVGNDDWGGDRIVEAAIGHLFDFVEPGTVDSMLLDAELREQILVVDVRGRDWVGGHIPLSINLRTSEVVKRPESLLAQCRQNRIQRVIFTCMYSVLRARKCAAAFEAAQVEEQQSHNAPYRIHTSLLRGGMHAWVNHFVGVGDTRPSRKDVHLASFDPEMWSDGGPSQGGLVHVMDALWSSGGKKALSDALTEELMSLQARLEDGSQRGSISPRGSNNE